MAKIDELKKTFMQNCQGASRDISSGEEEPAGALITLGITGAELIRQAYEAGRQSLADELIKGTKTLGGRK